MLIALVALAVLTTSLAQPPVPASTKGVVAPCPPVSAGTPAVSIGATHRPKVESPTVMPRTPPGLRKTTGVANVELRAIVDVDGRPCDLVVMSQSHPELGADTVSVSAARQWRFEPATRDGGPVRASVTFEFRYEARAPQDGVGSPEWIMGLSVRGADYPSGLWSRQDLSPLP
jgi:periplasmic protein TonB